MNELIYENYDDYRINVKDLTVSAWSPKLDLIALGSASGDLCIYRLRMILIWKIAIKDEGHLQCICWHPDGNLFAVGFQSGLIQYYSIKYPYCLYHIKYNESITCLQWVALQDAEILKDNRELPYDMKDIFPLKENLYKNSVYKGEIKRIEELLRLKNKFSILIGVKGLSIFFLSRGLFNLGIINVEDRRTSSYDKIYSACLSPNFDSISYVMQMYNENGEQAFRIFVVNCDFIRENLCQISNVSTLFVDIIYLRLIIQKHMLEIEESWEDCLNLFERGLMEYTKRKKHIPTWSLKNDFMKLIISGICDKNFWIILEENLSLYGVKGISGTVTKMSSHIINHCCPNMHFSLMRLLFHANELYNLLKFPSEYGFLNISNESISIMTDACGSTLSKLHEFQIILSDNVDNLNLFFRWINDRIDYHIGEMNTPESFSHSQLLTINDFITNKLQVIKDSNNEVLAYKIEILHQYLCEGDLIAPQLADSNSYLLNLINMSDSMEHSVATHKNGFFKIRQEKSLSNLVSIFLPDIIDKICWKHDNKLIKNHSNPSESYPITLAAFSFDVNENDVLMTYESYSEDCDNECVEVCAFYHPTNPVLIWMQNKIESIKSCSIHLNALLALDINLKIKVIKLQFYNSNTLFLLVSTSKEETIENSYLLVLFWNEIEANHSNKIRVHCFKELFNEYFTIWPVDNNYLIDLSNIITSKTMELLPVDATDMTISRSRRLALIFFGHSRERCRIFVLEDI